MKILFFIACSLLVVPSVIAQNLAPNPSFEEFETCPRGFSSIGTPGSPSPSVSNWFRSTDGTSDYFNACATTLAIFVLSVPGNHAGTQTARTGDAYCGIYSVGVFASGISDYREYLQAQLSKPLPAGHEILVSYWLSFAENYNITPIDQFGAFFDEDSYYEATTDRLTLVPQVTSPFGILYNDEEGWQEVTGSFIAAGNEDWVMLGNFTDIADMGIEEEDETLAYYYIDDVCILDLDSVAPENLSVIDTISCTGEPLELSSHIAEADDYLWEDGSTAATRMVTESGTYWVRSVDRSACAVYMDSFYVTLGGPVPDFSLGNDTALCRMVAADGFLLDVDFEPGVSIFTWQDGSHDNSFNVTETGFYWLEVKNDCFTKSDSIRVIVAPASLDILNNDTTICDGAEIVVNAIGSDQYTYQWSPSEGVTNPNSLNTIITVNGNSEYILRGSFPGCPDTLQHIFFTVEPSPTVRLREDTAICWGETLLLEPEIRPFYEDYSYSWTPTAIVSDTEGPNVMVTTRETATVYFNVSTPTGCEATDSITITVKPPLLLNVSADTGICPSESVPLRAQNAASYQWIPSYGLNNDAIANPVASPGTTTEYQVIGVAENGCVDTETVMVNVYPEALVSLPDSVTIWPGESYQVDMNSNCQYFDWFPFSGLSDNNVASPVAMPEVRTRYFVTATTENGCVAIDSIDVLVNTETVIDMPNAFVPGNGSNNTFKAVRRGIATLTSFRIYNRWGNLIFESKNIDQGWDGSFNGNPQPAGVYIYTIEAVTASGRPFVKQGNVTLLR